MTEAETDNQLTGKGTVDKDLVDRSRKTLCGSSVHDVNEEFEEVINIYQYIA